MTTDPSLRSVRDAHGHRLEYIVRPAGHPAAARTIVVFHGAGHNRQASKLVSPDWNVVVPLDRTSESGQGSDWVGRADDPFLVDLVVRAIADARAEFGGDQGLYTWGSSIGGFAAILYGILCQAVAVRALSCTIRLSGVPYRSKYRQIHLGAGPGVPAGPFDDLVALVQAGVPWRLPFFSIVEPRYDGWRFLEEHGLDFSAACSSRGVGFHLEVLPRVGHHNNESSFRALQYFNEHDPFISAYHRTPHPAATTPERFVAAAAGVWNTPPDAGQEAVERGRLHAAEGTGLALASQAGPWPEGHAGPGSRAVARWANIMCAFGFLADIIAAHRHDGDDRLLEQAGLMLHEWSLRLLENPQGPFAPESGTIRSDLARVDAWARFVVYVVQEAPLWATANERLLRRLVAGLRVQGMAFAALDLTSGAGAKAGENRDRVVAQLSRALVDDSAFVEPRTSSDVLAREPAAKADPDSIADRFARLGKHAVALAGSRHAKPPKSDSKACLRARRFLGEGLLELREWPPVPFASPYDWSIGEGKPGWWRHDLHRQYVVADLLLDYEATGDVRSLDRALEVALSWIDAHPCPEAGVKGTSSRAWSDHSTCLRAEVFSRIVILACSRDPIWAADRACDLLRLRASLVEHAVLQSDPGFEVAGHNHGWDQARAQWLLSYLLRDDPRASQWRRRASERLRDESVLMFAADGAHVENSPGDAFRALTRLADLLALANGRITLSDLFPDPDELLPRVARAIAASLRPDGTPPLLGDSHADTTAPSRFPVPLSDADAAHWSFAVTAGRSGEAPPWTSLICPEGGYAFLRNHWPTSPGDPTAIHAIVKGGPLSRVHIHDDDGHVLLWAHGEDWLIDSGPFAYEETDPIRIHVRSRLAHNVVVVSPSTPRPRKIDRDNPFWRITASSTDPDVPFVAVESRRDPGVVRSRTVILSGGALLVRDEVEVIDGQPRDIQLRWHVAGDRSVDARSGEAIVLAPSGRRMRIAVGGGADAQPLVERGFVGDRVAAVAAYMRTDVQPAVVIAFPARVERRLEVTTRIDFPPPG